MALQVTSLDELDPDLVLQAQAEITELIQEQYPDAEIRRGPIHDLVLHLSGVANAVDQTMANRLLASSSLLEITEDPTLADDTQVDRVLSNFRVTRKEGATATGSIAIVVSADVSTVVAADAVYEGNGVNFTVDDSYVAKPTGSQLLSPTEVLLEARGDGTFVFAVPATAVDVGVAGNIPRSTKMTPDTAPARFVTAFAASDFTGGRDTETNTDLLARLDLGIAAPVMQGRSNMEALIKAQPEFEDTLQYSIIGYGNPEMGRDAHWIFPVHGGGRIDVYARPAALPVSVEVRKTAVLMEKPAGGGIWQFSLTKDDAPGFYEVGQVLLPSDAAESDGFPVTMDLRGYDLTGDDLLPDVIDATEAAYSRYQTAVIRFQDKETSVASLAIGATAEYVVAVRAMPLIAELQAFCVDQSLRNLASDILVKAAVPCFLTINCDIEIAAGTADPDVDAIKNALVETINSLNFPGQLHTSTVADVIHGFLVARQAVSRIELSGRIRQPDGQTVYITDTAVLTIPDTPASMVTGQTTAFILYPDDIGLAVVTKGFGTGI